MTETTKSFAETYSMRSTFFQLLGEAGKLLAEAYTQADRENQRTMNELAYQAMAHALIEFEGYKPEELVKEVPWFPPETAPASHQVLVWRHDADVPWIYGLRDIASWEHDAEGYMAWFNSVGEEIRPPVLWTHLASIPPRPEGWVAGAPRPQRIKPAIAGRGSSS